MSRTAPAFTTTRKPGGGGARGHLQRWIAVAAVVMIAGSAAAVLAASSVASKDAARQRLALVTSAANVAKTLQSAILHEQDLIVSAGGFVAGSPGATAADFKRWGASVQALQRYPELVGLGRAVLVSRAELPSFASRAATHGPFHVIPAGVRPYYCFYTTGFTRTGKSEVPPGYDVCSGAQGHLGLRARDSGLGAYLPMRTGTGAPTMLAILSPVYRGGMPPSTVAARRAAFLGWVGTDLLPKVILDRALADHPNLNVTFTYAASGSHAEFRSAAEPSGSSVVTTNLHNGWTVRTWTVLPAAGLFTNSTAVMMLVAGIALSFLMAALLFVLATGRVRALSLVDEKTDELRHRALHDALTGLPNRALIMDRIEQLMARNLRDGTMGAALYIDLDGFKNVNDTLGHGVGDLLLQAVAARFTATLRDADTIGRMGGDEFVILLDNAAPPEGPEMVAERLMEAMRQPFQLKGSATPVLITASVGIAVGNRETPEQLLREADMALYQAKAAGKNNFDVYRTQMGTELQRRYELEFDLRAALECGQLRVHYQPIYNLGDLSVIGAEALLRWEHPTMGQIQPDDFVPLLESTGQIVDVGRWVLREACAQMAAWRARGSELTVSVNISARQLDRDILVDDVRAALDVSGLDPSALTLEITETALMRNVEDTARRLHELKALGIHVAIDDFGTGYSSLAYLQRFPVDCLKIDRTFTDALTRSRESEALVRTLVQLGKDLGLKTLAEGVETPAQLDYLRAQDVDEIQGFLLARPLSADVLETKIFEPAHPPNPNVSLST